MGHTDKAIRVFYKVQYKNCWEPCKNLNIAPLKKNCFGEDR